jgi:hypothetical protein
MNIALDYDDTYTLDKDTWNKVIDTFIKYGHKVYCVTKRYENISEDIKQDMNIPIIYATKSKLEAVRKANIQIDIWIDDKPQSITPYRSKTFYNNGFRR